MTAAAAILATAAVVMFGYRPVFALLDARRVRRVKAAEAESRARANRARLVLAASEPTPIYDRLVCEAIEREEGWVS